jgi:F0F1-type ATP synthase assembly protein I
VVEEKRTIEKMWALAEEKMTCDDQHKRTSETSQHQAMEMKVVRMEEQINALLCKWLVGWLVDWLVGWVVGWVIVVFFFLWYSWFFVLGCCVFLFVLLPLLCLLKLFLFG